MTTTEALLVQRELELDQTVPLTSAIFKRTLQHPQLGRFIAWAPVGWLVEISNPDFLADTTLNGSNGPRVTLTELSKNLRENGMEEPFILGIGLEDEAENVRLNTGNQRIQIIWRQIIEGSTDIRDVPVVGLLGKTAIIDPANGVHAGTRMLLDEVALERYEIGNYVNPMEVITGTAIADAGLMRQPLTTNTY